eukprot:Seg3329.3 transcript_id=Seg3329.3/GoldUCD/mRNA.D3Y31 product="hypothetical protein" protein_id=Seg3329.3/GoldUCD/D3Y31
MIGNPEQQQQSPPQLDTEDVVDYDGPLRVEPAEPAGFENDDDSSLSETDDIHVHTQEQNYEGQFNNDASVSKDHRKKPNTRQREESTLLITALVNTPSSQEWSLASENFCSYSRYKLSQTSMFLPEISSGILGSSSSLQPRMTRPASLLGSPVKQGPIFEDLSPQRCKKTLQDKEQVKANGVQLVLQN